MRYPHFVRNVYYKSDKMLGDLIDPQSFSLWP